MRSVLDLLQRLMLLVQPVDAVIPPALQAICARLQTTVSVLDAELGSKVLVQSRFAVKFVQNQRLLCPCPCPKVGIELGCTKSTSDF